jgi:glycosyltransferase involved in cell wall biosynthesis
MAALVDVILPTLDDIATIRPSIESLLNQTLTDLRVIVIDDGSSMPSACLLKDIAASDPRITLVRQENAGIVDALNRGLTFTDAPFVARQDGDDISAPDRLSRQVGFLLSNPEFVAVSGGVRHIDREGNVTGTYAPPDPTVADFTHIPAIEPYLIHPFLTVRREAIMSIGGYRHVHHAEDADLYWRLREHGRLFNLVEIMGDYRVHDKSISGSSVLNGRIMATSSQLASISAERRHKGEPDVYFARTDLADYRAARKLGAIVEMAGAKLSAKERSIFNIAVAAKMLELASYRPWDLDLDDCRFIRTQWQIHNRSLPHQNRKEFRKAMMRLGAGLLHKGRVRALIELIPPDMIPGLILRFAKYLFIEPVPARGR